jgi:hypothetical protein
MIHRTRVTREPRTGLLKKGRNTRPQKIGFVAPNELPLYQMKAPKGRNKTDRVRPQLSALFLQPSPELSRVQLRDDE